MVYKEQRNISLSFQYLKEKLEGEYAPLFPYPTTSHVCVCSHYGFTVRDLNFTH